MGKSRPHRDRLTRAVAEEINKFKAACHNKLLSDNFEPNNPLYHYTDLRGLDAIVSTETFRLSGLSHLRHGSDRKEIEYSIAIARQVLQEHQTEDRLEQLHVQSLLGILSWERFTEDFDVYIGCFTRHAEDPEVWRRFGREDTGVALGIRASHFKSHPAVEGVVDYILQPVGYGEAEIRTRVGKGLQVALGAIRRGRAAAHKRRDLVEVLSAVGMQFLGTYGIPVVINTKEDSYRVEAELRGSYIHPASKRGGQPRPEFVFTRLPREEITDIYLGRKTNRDAVAEILRRNAINPKIHEAYY